MNPIKRISILLCHFLFHSSSFTWAAPVSLPTIPLCSPNELLSSNEFTLSPSHVGLWSRHQRSLNKYMNNNNQSKGSPVSWCVCSSDLNQCSDGSFELVLSLHCSLNLSVTAEGFAAGLGFCRDVNSRLILTASRLIPHDLLPYGTSASLTPHL